MANDENTRLALLEEKFNRLAEDMGMITGRQDKFEQWKHEHELIEVDRHNRLMTAITALQTAVEEINKKGTSRLASFDRLVIVIPAIIALAGSLFWVYNLIKGTPITGP